MYRESVFASDLDLYLKCILGIEEFLDITSAGAQQCLQCSHAAPSAGRLRTRLD